MKLAVLAGSLAVVAVRLFGPPAGAPAGEAAQAQAQAPRPVFRTGVDLVEIAVLVRDADGRLVRDLGASDFHVVEEGIPQTISAFEHVSIPVLPAGRAAGRDGAAPPDVTSNDAASDARIFVLVLDATHVAAERTKVVRAEARQFVERHVGPADLVAVVSPGGLPSATQDFTSDRARLLRAIDEFAGNKLQSATVERDQEARQTTAPPHGGLDPSDGERAFRAQSLVDALDALARHFDRVAGRRKALLLFTEGYDYDLTDVMGRFQRQGNDVMRSLARAIGSLQRTNVSVYPIDPRRLSSAGRDQLETPIYRPIPDANEPSVYTEYNASIRNLRALADSTGGFAAVDSNDVGPAFERIAAESGDYYLLGYTPSKPARPGESRAVSVRVGRPGVHVSARKGYTVPAARPRSRPVEPSPDPVATWTTGRPRTGRVEPVAPAPSAAAAPMNPAASEELTLLLASPLPQPGLPIRVQAVPFKGDGRNAIVQLIVEVAGRSLAFDERGGRFEERVDLALLTVDDRARASNGRSTRIDLKLTGPEAERVRATGVRWLARLELAPGRHQIRVAGRAARAASTGVTTHEVDVPDFDAARPSLSGVTLTSLPSVLLVTRGDSWLQQALGGSSPSAARSFVAGDRLAAAFEVYLPAAFHSAASVTARLEWPDGSRSPVGSAAFPAGRGFRGEIVSFPVETDALPPGRYVLRVTLASTPGEPAFERRVPLEIVSAPAR